MRRWKNAKEKYNIKIGGQKQYLISCSLSANINIKDDQEDEEWARLLPSKNWTHRLPRN
jgi:hypothetical protein